MKDSIKRITLLCGTGAVLLAGWRTVPVMEAVTTFSLMTNPTIRHSWKVRDGRFTARIMKAYRSP